MDIVIGIIFGVIILTLLVVVHELGHAIVARRNGVVVEEFGIGFPPRAWAKKLKNGVLFTLNWLPMGGFVKLQGENDSATGKGDYGAASFWQKTKILLAGVFMNLATAVVLLSFLALVGMPKILPDQFYVASDAVIEAQPVEVTYVAKDSVAEKAGLRVGDKITRFDGQAIESSQELTDKTKAKKGQTVEIIYTRGDAESTVKTTLKSVNENNQGYLGVGSAQREVIRSTWSAPIVGAAVTAQFTGATFQGLGDMVSGAARGFVMQFSPDSKVKAEAQADLKQAGDSVTGPVGIFGVIFPAANKAGATQVILLTAIISLSLAVMNALPIPALDGGRWFVTAVFRLLKKPLTKDLEERIHGYGFLALIILIIGVTILDVGKILG